MRKVDLLILLFAVLFGVCVASVACAKTTPELRVATFCCDITPPLGQPMISCDAIRTVEQPLLAKGIVLEVGADRYVLCALDWCLVGNGSYETMRSRIAAAVGVEVAHVAMQSVHQHTAPLVDMDAQKLLLEIGAPELQMDPKVFDAIGQRLADAAKQSLSRLEPFDRVGTGQAKVDRVASSRRALDADGKIHVRYSSCKDPSIRALPEGTIDPYLKTITFARGQKPLVRLHYYATHPQTSCGDGRASSDVVGDAREKLQRKEGVFQIYFTGCSGDVTMGKYNDRSRRDRDALASRLLVGMEASVAATRLEPVGPIRWRTCPLLMPARNDPGFTLADYLTCMKDQGVVPVRRVYHGAGRVAFLRRIERPIELTSLEIGNVHIVNLPGEPMICFQQFAQSLKPSDFVAVAGYGDCGPGYICPAKAYHEGGYEPTSASVTPESELLLKKAIATLLGVD
ncbi:MAG: hypothetical protein ABFC77_05605 [Thermoguttaceae bacterium]